MRGFNSGPLRSGVATLRWVLHRQSRMIVNFVSRLGRVSRVNWKTVRQIRDGISAGKFVRNFSREIRRRKTSGRVSRLLVFARWQFSMGGGEHFLRRKVSPSVYVLRHLIQPATFYPVLCYTRVLHPIQPPVHPQILYDDYGATSRDRSHVHDKFLEKFVGGSWLLSWLPSALRSSVLRIRYRASSQSLEDNFLSRPGQFFFLHSQKLNDVKKENFYIARW